MSIAPTRRTTPASLGKTWTTSARRLISRLSLSRRWWRRAAARGSAGRHGGPERPPSSGGKVGHAHVPMGSWAQTDNSCSFLEISCRFRSFEGRVIAVLCDRGVQLLTATVVDLELRSDSRPRRAVQGDPSRYHRGDLTIARRIASSASSSSFCRFLALSLGAALSSDHGRDFGRVHSPHPGRTGSVHADSLRRADRNRRRRGGLRQRRSVFAGVPKRVWRVADSIQKGEAVLDDRLGVRHPLERGLGHKGSASNRPRTKDRMDAGPACSSMEGAWQLHEAWRVLGDLPCNFQQCRTQKRELHRSLSRSALHTPGRGQDEGRSWMDMRVT